MVYIIKKTAASNRCLFFMDMILYVLNIRYYMNPCSFNASVNPWLMASQSFLV